MLQCCSCGVNSVHVSYSLWVLDTAALELCKQRTCMKIYFLEKILKKLLTLYYLTQSDSIALLKLPVWASRVLSVTSSVSIKLCKCCFPGIPTLVSRLSVDRAQNSTAHRTVRVLCVLAVTKSC